MQLAYIIGYVIVVLTNLLAVVYLDRLYDWNAQTLRTITKPLEPCRTSYSHGRVPRKELPQLSALYPQFHILRSSFHLLITHICMVTYVVDDGSWPLCVEASMIQTVKGHHQSVDQLICLLWWGSYLLEE